MTLISVIFSPKITYFVFGAVVLPEQQEASNPVSDYRTVVGVSVYLCNLIIE